MSPMVHGPRMMKMPTDQALGRKLLDLVGGFDIPR